MKILDRYMLRSLLVPLAVCLASFALLFTILDLFDHLNKFLDARTPAFMIAAYYLALLLPTLEYLAPASLLLGTLYALWQLTRHHELTAMQASGLGLHRVLRPYLAVGLAFALALIAIKETVGIRAFAWTEQYRASKFKTADTTRTERLIYFDSQTRRQWFIERFNESRPDHLVDVKITQERTDGTRVRDWVASRADYLDGTWWLYNLRLQAYDANDNPVGQLTPVAPDAGLAREVPELTEDPDSFVIQSRNWEFLSTPGMLRYLREHPEISRQTARSKWYDVHSRIATPWACLVVTLFGIPVGALTGRRSPLTGVFLALGCFFAYYTFTHLGLLLGKSGATEPWLGAWLSNIVFGVSGIAMLWRLR